MRQIRALGPDEWPGIGGTLDCLVHVVWRSALGWVAGVWVAVVVVSFWKRDVLLYASKSRLCLSGTTPVFAVCPSLNCCWAY